MTHRLRIDSTTGSRAPSIATDPRSPSEVYVGFAARSVTSPDQVDLFVAWTNTANALFPPGPTFQGPLAGWGPSQQTYRIPDALLLASGDPTSGFQAEQFLPVIAIDDLGGVNIAYLQVFDCNGCESPPPSQVTVRYARWPDRAALEAGTPPSLHILSPPSEPWATVTGFDYIGITASQCTAYVAWASKHSGAWQVYANRINLPCPADADDNGLINVQDPIAFGAAYVAQQPPADVNMDGVVSPQDFVDFLSAYACGSCPIP